MKSNFKIIILSFLTFFLCVDISAYASLSEARELLSKQKFAEALEMAVADIAANSKGKDFGALQQVAGEACTALGNYSQARDHFVKAKSKGIQEAFLGLARVDMLQYRFDDAYENYSKFKGTAGESGCTQAMLASDFLSRVQRVVVVDTICVSSENFFQAYELSPDAGSLKPKTVSNDVDGKVVYCNEADMMRIYSKKDESGYLHLVMSDCLTDGSWEETPVLFGSDDEDEDQQIAETNYDYPFMLSDGVTLYFAHDGNAGIGGYDIYVANGEPLSGKFMNPGNLGMPFNSPANDYMFAIDEERQLGWWATDRHHPGGDLLTIYIFAPDEVRVNYPDDDRDIQKYARGILWKETPEANERYKALDK